MKYFLGFDQGTTTSKGIIFDELGNIHFKSQKKIPILFPKKGWVEQNPEDIWNTCFSIINKAIDYSISNNFSICGLGITNQRETTIIWDKKTGVPIYNAIVWQDRRTIDFCNQLKSLGYEKVINEKTGLFLDPYFSASKINWILKFSGNLDKKGRLKNLAFGTVDSFLIWRLTNGKNHFTDITNASRTSIFNINNKSWDEELIQLFQVGECLLPEVKESADFFGETSTRILKQQISILSVLGDQQAASLGQCCTNTGDIKCTFGTGSFMLANTGENKIISKSKMISTIAYGINKKVNYALEGSVFVSGAIFDWLKDGLKIISSYNDIEKLAMNVEDNKGLYIVPSFYGLGCPYWDSKSKGLICGITSDMTSSHFVRAALESVAYQTNDILIALKKDAFIPKSIKVDGGMVINEFLMQFMSDICGCIIEKPKVFECTSFGIAMLAALYDGRFNTLDDIKKIWQLGAKYSPKFDQKKKEKLILGWENAIKKTKTL